MSVKSDKVKSGYAELSYSEKEEVKKWINDFDRATSENQRNLSEGISKAFNKGLGPKDSSSCPCCGK
ncbi:MAG: hypothetical protein JWQ79_1868 [Mucilaginibacter sp.]|nr:hypothetical protein [Mucilaginibacter sp.]